VKTSEIPGLLEAAQSYVSLMTRGGTLAGAPLVEQISKEHEEKDWMRIVQEDWKPRLVGVAEEGNRALVVSLPFHTPDDVSALLSSVSPSSSAVEIKLTGGGAFGTGEHVTTRMCSMRCLSIVEGMLASPPGGGVNVLDYGAGSGLISLACLTAKVSKGGTVKAYGVEVDRTAVEAARVNAELNGWTVGREFEMFRPPAGAPGAELWDDYTGCESQDPAATDVGVDELSDSLEGSFGLVVANILAGSLIELHDTLARFAQRAGGRLVLSGILEEQAATVVEYYNKGGAWSDVRVEKVEEGWAMIGGIRK